MAQQLGSAEHIAQRHEARLHRIRLIESEMLRLQQKHREQLDLSKRDSGTCDHLEVERDGIVMCDAGINTVMSEQSRDYHHSHMTTELDGCGDPAAGYENT